MRALDAQVWAHRRSHAGSHTHAHTTSRSKRTREKTHRSRERRGNAYNVIETQYMFGEKKRQTRGGDFREGGIQRDCKFSKESTEVGVRGFGFEAWLYFS